MREEKEKTIYKMNHKWNYQPPSQEQTEAAKALAKEKQGSARFFVSCCWKEV